MIDLDPDTISRAQNRDDAACRTIIEALHRPVIATIYRFLGQRFRSEVEDIAQDVFLKIFRAIERFDPQRGVKFSTWAYTFVRNHCFDVLKKRRLHAVSLSANEADQRQLDPDDPRAVQPVVIAEISELGAKIEEALAGLGEEQRMVFVLREYEGLDYDSIAEVMGVSQGTIKSRLHRAKVTLRNRLEPYMRAGA